MKHRGEQEGVPTYEISTMMRLPTVAFYVLATYSQHFDTAARFLFLETDFARIWVNTIASYAPFYKFQILFAALLSMVNFKSILIKTF